MKNNKINVAKITLLHFIEQLDLQSFETFLELFVQRGTLSRILENP